MYISPSDLDTRFGAANVRAWSNLDNTAAAGDAGRVAAAIAWAEDYVNNRLRPSRYAVPLTGRGGALYQVKAWATGLAGWHLYTARGLRDTDNRSGQHGHKLTALRQAVDCEIDEVLAGRIGLDAVENEASGGGGAAPSVSGVGF